MILRVRVLDRPMLSNTHKAVAADLVAAEASA
jgi:hypothetical protein